MQLKCSYNDWKFWYYFWQIFIFFPNEKWSINYYYFKRECKLIFTPFLVLKDEPDDLTHLAPIAGDACIPLDESVPFFSDMFDDFIIPDNYNLLTDELNSLDSQCSSKSTTTSNGSNSSSCNDPFINYRDDSNDTNNSPHLLSPGLSKVKFSIHHSLSTITTTTHHDGHWLFSPLSLPSLYRY